MLDHDVCTLNIQFDLSVWITQCLFSSFTASWLWPILLRLGINYSYFLFSEHISSNAQYMFRMSSLTSLDSSLELYTGSEFFLLLFVLFVSFLAGCGFRPLPLVPRRPTPLVSSSAANANKSAYCFYRKHKRINFVQKSMCYS